MKRRSVFERIAYGVAMLVVALAATAQPYPSRPVKLIIPYPPGGGTDVLGRAIAQELGRTWSQSVVVENRAGAGGMIGTDAVAKSAPDGYTIVQATMAANAVAPSLYAKVPYDSERDFNYVAPIGRQASVLLANTKVPVTTFAELVAYAKGNKGKATYSGPGIGLSGHLGMEMILRAASMPALHVPYKGSAPASQAMAAGETDMTLDLVSTGLAYVQSGRARALAVTGEARASQFPDTPNFRELGYPDLVIYTWQGLAVPAGTPRDVVQKLHRDVQAAKQAPELRERLQRLGIEVFDATPEAFAEYVRAESKRWGDLVRNLGIKAE